jgi:hypothetical protein
MNDLHYSCFIDLHSKIKTVQLFVEHGTLSQTCLQVNGFNATWHFCAHFYGVMQLLASKIIKSCKLLPYFT